WPLPGAPRSGPEGSVTAQVPSRSTLHGPVPSRRYLFGDRRELDSQDVLGQLPRSAYQLVVLTVDVDVGLELSKHRCEVSTSVQEPQVTVGPQVPGVLKLPVHGRSDVHGLTSVAVGEHSQRWKVQVPTHLLVFLDQCSDRLVQFECPLHLFCGCQQVQ